MNLNKSKRVLRLARNTLFIVAGNALLAFLVEAFILPHDIVMGGVTGVGIVLNRVSGGMMDTALSVLIMNTALLILGGVVLGRKFALTTVASSVIYPVFLALFHRIPGIDSMTENILLSAIFAGTLMGASIGLVMRAGSSTGGTDIINLVLAKWTHLPVAIFVWLVDIVIIGGQIPLSRGAEPILYGILVLVLESVMVDKTIIFGKAKAEVFAVSPKYEEIRRRLLTEVRTGVTLSLIETGGMRERQKAVICVTTPRNLYRITDLILAVDPDAFLTVTRIREVQGQGFTRARVEKPIKAPESDP